MARKSKKVVVSGRPQVSALSEKGQEIPDSTPHTASLGKRRAKSIRDNVVEILRSEKWREAMEENGEETFEEADDFDVDDDFDPSTPYEEFFEGEYALLREARLESKKTETNERRRKKDTQKTEPPKASAPVERAAGEGGQTPPKAAPAPGPDHS